MAGERISVLNRGGMVFCTTHISEDAIVTTLAGNATFEWWGVARFDGSNFDFSIERHTTEQEVWLEFVESINRTM